MSHGDPLDSLEDALFRAVRRERPKSEVLERTANAVVASYRWRRLQRVALTLGGAMALAAGLALILRGSPSTESIQAEQIAPKRSVPSLAALPSVSEQSEAAAGPRSAPSGDALLDDGAFDDATDLRSGLAPSVASTTLEEEIVMLDAVRSQLAAGKPESALSLLNQYNRVSGGHLTMQATLLRVEALSSSGRALLAAKLAQRVVDSDPNGPLAERARAYIPKPPLGAQDQGAGAQQKP